ncbi:MAG: flagellar hook-length control protein FliK [Spirochaetaceae bacterium]|nr:flagellar hook-length control protein FliK [Spirochaetaceae bacterium]
MVDIGFQSQSNLLNLLPAVARQETGTLVYHAGESTRTASQVETAEAPHVERFEQILERIRVTDRMRAEEQSRHTPEPSAVERGASPDRDLADDTGTGAGEDGARRAGRADKKGGEDGKGNLPAAKQGRAERPQTGAERADTERDRGEDLAVDEDALAGMPALGMARPAAEQSDTKGFDEDAFGSGNTVAGEGEEAVAVGTGAAPALDGDAEFALSGEEGITLTDTHPLFENKPDARGMGFESLVDDASAPDLAEEAEVWLANGKEAAAGAAGARQKDGTKGDLKNGDARSGEGGEVPESLRTVPDADYQLASFTRADAEKGAKAELAADRKKADSKKLNVEVRDMRSASASSAQGGVFAETDAAESARIPVKDLLVEVKGDALASIGSGSGVGDSHQNQAGFDQFRGADMKSAAQLESFLSRELHNGLNGDIVRQASVMLRDGGEGLIRLQLHPESLGNVRIKLSMSGNRVEGVITVESPEALNAFERELASLEMAFRDSGFEGASLNMQMSGGKSGDDFDGAQAGAFSQVLAASSYDSSANVQDGESRSIYEQGNLSILA